MIYKTIEMLTARNVSIKLKLEPMDSSTLEIKIDDQDSPTVIYLDGIEMEELAKILQEGAKYEKKETV